LRTSFSPILAEASWIVSATVLPSIVEASRPSASVTPAPAPCSTSRCARSMNASVFATKSVSQFSSRRAVPEWAMRPLAAVRPAR
jgi:hypothetical protein